MPEAPERRGLLTELLRAEARFFPRIAAVLRFDAAIYAEIQADAQAIPQAFAAVIATSLLIGLGQGGVAALFLGVAAALASWLIVAAAIWGVATLATDREVGFPSLMRCLGFAYVWSAAHIGDSLPLIGVLFGWVAVAATCFSLVLATRQVVGVSTQRAAAICAVSLGAPLVLLWIVSSCAG